jgi:hypothetical protein
MVPDGRTDGFEGAKSIEDLGLRLLKSVGLPENLITDELMRRRSPPIMRSWIDWRKFATMLRGKFNDAAAISES